MKINQAEFDQLPALLRRKQFLQLTGLNKNDLRELVKQGVIGVSVVRVYARYYKSDAAKYLKFKQ